MLAEIKIATEMEALNKYKETREKLFNQAGISPKSNFATVNDSDVKKVHYLELGSGKPLILIHGGLSHSSEWFPMLKQLSNHFHLFVVDRPGHGLTDPINYTNIDYEKSSINFIHSFMDSVGLQKASLLGNSMGGYFAICFGMSYPERVDKLLLIGAPAGMNRWVPLMLRLLGTKGINKLLAKTFAKPSISNLKMVHRQILVASINQLPEVYFENCYHHMLLPEVMVAHRTMLENVLTIRGWKAKYYLTDRLNQLEIPAHFIWGDQDAFEKYDTGLQKAKKIKAYTFKVVENAGHCPWLDRPGECSSLIIGKMYE
ncbi:alpha/beta hydrolase [Cyclobacterium sp.]|uniref:alpha/beta fold hydrolase n=1 Tax=Cyclobacterium sp. TaxID=1966343 RepID=UPI0019CEA881|nr:alpha/beta hydrolase [Cyclobacterium sp.]MBD3628003.1 alpha/beta hydrolase [Cyclobacterium sp.]